MKKILILLITLLICPYLDAQVSDKEAIKATIDRVFEGMKKGDSSIARSAFHPKASMHGIGFSDKTNTNYFRFESRFEGFMKAIGTLHPEVWNEIPGQYEIRIDKQMAHVWMPYEFYLGDKFSHCGINNFTLYKEDKDWKIIYLVDTMRKDNCVK